MSFNEEYFNLGFLDTLSYKDTAIHRLDPRTKVIATIAFVVTVVSFPKYEITGLIPFFIFPALIFLWEISLCGSSCGRFLLSRHSQFSSASSIPCLMTMLCIALYGIHVSGGWISFLSILLKFLLTISAAFLLISTTSFPGICHALRKLRMPEMFISQLLFLYRYIFVLVEEALRMVRARDMRSFGKEVMG